jgi:hypothetical protein
MRDGAATGLRFDVLTSESLGILGRGMRGGGPCFWGALFGRPPSTCPSMGLHLRGGPQFYLEMVFKLDGNCFAEVSSKGMGLLLFL